MYTDMLGNEISVGAWLARGALDDRSGVIKIGYVLELFPENINTPKKKFSTISFEYQWWSGPTKGQVIINKNAGHSKYPERNLVIPKDMIPDYIQNSLADWLETVGLKYLEAMLEKKG